MIISSSYDNSRRRSIRSSRLMILSKLTCCRASTSSPKLTSRLTVTIAASKLLMRVFRSSISSSKRPLKSRNSLRIAFRCSSTRLFFSSVIDASNGFAACLLMLSAIYHAETFCFSLVRRSQGLLMFFAATLPAIGGI